MVDNDLQFSTDRLNRIRMKQVSSLCCMREKKHVWCLWWLIGFELTHQEKVGVREKASTDLHSHTAGHFCRQRTNHDHQQPSRCMVGSCLTTILSDHDGAETDWVVLRKTKLTSGISDSPFALKGSRLPISHVPQILKKSTAINVEFFYR